MTGRPGLAGGGTPTDPVAGARLLRSHGTSPNLATSPDADSPLGVDGLPPASPSPAALRPAPSISHAVGASTGHVPTSVVAVVLPHFAASKRIAKTIWLRPTTETRVGAPEPYALVRKNCPTPTSLSIVTASGTAEVNTPRRNRIQHPVTRLAVPAK